MEVLTGEHDALQATATEADGISREVRLGLPHHDITFGQPGSVEGAEPWSRGLVARWEEAQRRRGASMR